MIWRNRFSLSNRHRSVINLRFSLLSIRKLVSYTLLIFLAIAFGLIISTRLSPTAPVSHLASDVSNNTSTTPSTSSTNISTSQSSQTSISNSVSSSVNSSTSPSDNITTQLNVTTNSSGSHVQGQVTNNGQTTNLPSGCPSDQNFSSGNAAVNFTCNQTTNGSNASNSVVQLNDNSFNNSMSFSSP